MTHIVIVSLLERMCKSFTGIYMGISLGVESLGYGMYTYSALQSNVKLCSKVVPFEPFPHITCVIVNPILSNTKCCHISYFFVIQIAINKIFYYKC